MYDVKNVEEIRPECGNAYKAMGIELLCRQMEILGLKVPRGYWENPAI
jgi:hypothetical protein